MTRKNTAITGNKLKNVSIKSRIGYEKAASDYVIVFENFCSAKIAIAQAVTFAIGRCFDSLQV